MGGIGSVSNDSEQRESVSLNKEDSCMLEYILKIMKQKLTEYPCRLDTLRVLYLGTNSDSMVNPEAPAGVLVAIAAALVVATITVLLGDSVVSLPVDPTSDDPEEVTEELERAEAGETTIGAATGPFPIRKL